MESLTRKRARAFVVTGFAMFALGLLVTFFRVITSAHYFSNASASAVVETVLSPVMGIVAVWSWWWLSQIRVASGHQSSLVRKGFYGLALQNVLYGVLILAVLMDGPVFNRNLWNVAPLWAQCWGSLAIAIGFVFLARGNDDAGDSKTSTDA